MIKVDKLKLKDDLERFYLDYIVEHDNAKEDEVRQMIYEFCPIDVTDLEHVEMELDGIRSVQDELNKPDHKLLKDKYQEWLDELWDQLNWLKDEYELENNLPF